MAEKTKKKKSSAHKRLIPGILLIIIIIAAFVAYNYYNRVYKSNIPGGISGTYLYIPTGATFETVKDSLYTKQLILNKASFEWLALKKRYPQKIRPGRYLVTAGMNNNDLINMLRTGRQSPVKLVFNSIRTTQQLAGRIGMQLECDSTELLKKLNDGSFLKKYGFKPATCIAMFIPNTYEFYWNTSAERFFEKMNQEYKKFWNGSRTGKAETAGLTPVEVSTLASIVEMETNMNDEKPVIAGVYMNRMKLGMPLEADPTLKFALGDFSIQRILNKDLQLDSPYNTYKYTGLPPGPICQPSIASLDAVLNYKHHEYLFFCAKSDLSGYHNFARTYPQHLENARAYQRALDKLNIKR